MPNEKTKPGVLVLHKWKRDFDDMTDAELRAVIYALIDYSVDGTVTDFSDRGLRIFFRECMDVTDMNTDKWERKRQTCSENGKKGGAPKGNQNAAKKKAKTTQTSQTTNINNNTKKNIKNNKNIDSGEQDISDFDLDDLVMSKSMNCF